MNLRLGGTRLCGARPLRERLLEHHRTIAVRSLRRGAPDSRGRDEIPPRAALQNSYPYIQQLSEIWLSAGRRAPCAEVGAHHAENMNYEFCGMLRCAGTSACSISGG